MKQAFRHHLYLVLVLLLGTLLLAGCANGGGEGNDQNQSLTILDWSGYDVPTFHQAYVDAHPDKLPQYAFFADDAEGFAKANSGFAFDLAHPCLNFWQLYVDNGLVQPIDTSRITNWADIYPKLAGQGQFNGQQYFLPYDWGYESILVRTDKVAEMPDSWADLWDPQYAGHISLFDSGETNHIITALALGFDPWNTTPEQNEQITQKLMEIKPNLLNYWVDYLEVTQLVASGDVWLAANTWNEAYTTLLDEGVPVEYINPKEGRLGWLCGYGISANTQNLDLAYDFLNALYEPASFATMGNDYSYGVSSQRAQELMDQDLVALMQIGDPEVLNQVVFYKGLTEEQRQIVTERWSAVKAAP